MTLGTSDKKKVYWLIGLGAIALYLVYSNLLSSPSVPPQPAASVASAPAADQPVPAATPAALPKEASGAPKRAGAKRNSEEFHPFVHSKRPEDQIDPLRVDPTLKLDLLAKLQSVEPSPNGRNLFQFGAPPAKAPDKALPPEPIAKVEKPFYGPKYVEPAPPAAKPAEPPPPPITLKYYGYSTARVNGKRTAFFLDGEDIYLAAEGDVLKKRYKVVRLGTTSVIMEDLDFKKQQTLPLAEEVQPS
jgi:hypothetical protein